MLLRRFGPRSLAPSNLWQAPTARLSRPRLSLPFHRSAARHSAERETSSQCKVEGGPSFKQDSRSLLDGHPLRYLPEVLMLLFWGYFTVLDIRKHRRAVERERMLSAFSRILFADHVLFPSVDFSSFTETRVYWTYLVHCHLDVWYEADFAECFKIEAEKLVAPEDHAKMQETCLALHQVLSGRNEMNTDEVMKNAHAILVGEMKPVLLQKVAIELARREEEELHKLAQESQKKEGGDRDDYEMVG
ncbi:hypothetical protein FPV67DRAFT_1468328 [Lyophyllum atratum]|nr:hypothetical protein FPV67DRAFT_1468328 [Lyophyllum atratum]